MVFGGKLSGGLAVVGLLRLQLLAEAGKLALHILLGFVEGLDSLVLLGGEGSDDSLLGLKIGLGNKRALLLLEGCILSTQLLELRVGLKGILSVIHPDTVM